MFQDFLSNDYISKYHTKICKKREKKRYIGYLNH